MVSYGVEESEDLELAGDGPPGEVVLHAEADDGNLEEAGGHTYVELSTMAPSSKTTVLASLVAPMAALRLRDTEQVTTTSMKECWGMAVRWLEKPLFMRLPAV